MPPPVNAASVWASARENLEVLAAQPDTCPEDLRQLGLTAWLALTGEPFAEPPAGEPFPWTRLDAAGITPELGGLPFLLARTLAADPSTAAALLETLNMLASLRPPVPGWPDMPGSDPAPPPEPRLPVPTHDELWTRTPAQLAASNRRRRHPTDVWNTLILLVAGGLGGFCGGVLYEKTHGPGVIGPVPIPEAAATENLPIPADVPLPPSPPVGSAATVARVERVKALQPDVANILRYAREMRRVATVPVSDGFPAQSQVARVIARFEWQLPASPNFHRTPLLLVLGYGNDPHASQQCADALAQAMIQSGVTSPIYTCGMGGEPVPEVEKDGVGAEGRFVEVWVAFTLF